MKQTENDLIISAIIRKKAAQQEPLTPRETELLEAWLAVSEQRREFERQFTASPHAGDYPEITAMFEREGTWGRIGDRVKPGKRRRLWLGAAVAAAMVLAVTVGVRFHLSPESNQDTYDYQASVPAIIPPATNRAVFQSYDGNRYYLENRDTTIVYGNSSLNITGGTISYSETGTPARPRGNNRITVPRGGIYSVTLEDGSVVHLNSDSELIFPAAFGEDARGVTLRGEAIFDVAEDPSRPFTVTSDRMNVTVLGTLFAISVYPDEPQATATLISGGVEVSACGDSRVLTPGMQASLSHDTEVLTTEMLSDPYEMLMWRDGVIVMDYSDLPSVMRMISRWYDIEVVYPEGYDETHTFTGLIDRTVDLATVLETLTRIGGPQFEIKDDRVYVK